MEKPYTYTHLMKDFRSGKTFCFGTWQDVYRDEFPTHAMPAKCPRMWIPHGMSYFAFERYGTDTLEVFLQLHPSLTTYHEPSQFRGSYLSFN